jgi:hypothetical protein
MPRKTTTARRAPTKRQTTVHLDPASLTQLEQRGARSDRGGGNHATSAVLRRRLAILESVIIHCDPRFTRGFPERYFDFVVSQLTAPETIPPDRIAALEGHLSHQPGFDDAAQAAGIDPAALREALRELTFAEKLALVDAAEVEQAR